MKILFCNPKNSQGMTHSRKGMYVPLGTISIATVLNKKFGDKISITVCDEDVEHAAIDQFSRYDMVCFYSTTYNYRTCVHYATIAKAYKATTILGGPHPTVLYENILQRQNCFDYIVRFEGEISMTMLVDKMLKKDTGHFNEIPNLAYKRDGKELVTSQLVENDLTQLPIPSRDFVKFDSYIDNFKKLYPDREEMRPGSLYSSKGCSWRDKTGGCIFCARLEQGVRFRPIEQIWEEIDLLRAKYKVNSIWDISDDNLNNIEWFKSFVNARPQSCKDLNFFIYSRVNFMSDKIMPYLQELNVKEVFLGVESGDNALLKRSFKGQTVKMILNAVQSLKKYRIKYFPSFILGLPGESEESMTNTLKLCEQLADLGGLDRLGCTILQPIPGSKSYRMVLEETEFGKVLKGMDEVDIHHLERYWVEQFTEVDYDTINAYHKKINNAMKNCSVFGGKDE